jgi:membrane associated rhomboid family serine protease
MTASATLIILVCCVLISYLGFQRMELRDKFLYSPYEIAHGKGHLGLLGHMWFHANWEHLLFNMMSFLFLGQSLEDWWDLEYGEDRSTLLFVGLYFFGGLAATIWPYLRHRENTHYRSLGASGAVAAVIFAAIVWNPTMKLGIMFIPFPIPAYWFGPLYLLLEYLAMKRGKSNIANDAHISGAIFGAAFSILLNPHKLTEFLQNF